LSPLYAPICLLGGVALHELAVRLRRTLPPADFPAAATVGLAALLLATVADYERFDNSFTRNGVPDLSIRMVLDSVHE
jgi:hypothetical protein